VSGPREVGGWLLVLAAAMMIWQPLRVALTASHVLAALPLRGWPMVAMILFRTIVASIGIGAGLAILGRRSAAMRLAAIALVLSATADVAAYSTSFLPNNLPPGDAPFYISACLAYHAAWLTYLVRSRRVRATLTD
jgi:hypothetical protein